MHVEQAWDISFRDDFMIVGIVCDVLTNIMCWTVTNHKGYPCGLISKNLLFCISLENLQLFPRISCFVFPWETCNANLITD
jgi:hypothetical protein